MKPKRLKPIKNAKSKPNEAARLKALELDYELRSLSHAISTQDKTEHDRAMARLHELTAAGGD